MSGYRKCIKTCMTKDENHIELSSSCWMEISSTLDHVTSRGMNQDTKENLISKVCMRGVTYLFRGQFKVPEGSVLSPRTGSYKGGFYFGQYEGRWTKRDRNKIHALFTYYN